jgi:hypothetical protein
MDFNRRRSRLESMSAHPTPRVTSMQTPPWTGMNARTDTMTEDAFKRLFQFPATIL